MSRKHVLDYTGATGKIARSNLARLGSEYVIQPKHDGAYCHVHLDRRGCVYRISSRTGADFGHELIGDLLGAMVGAPGAVMAGELTAHTEAGNREASTLGQRRVHLFDCIRGEAGRYLGRLSYSRRRAELWRMQSQVENMGPTLPWYDDGHRIRNIATGRYCLPLLTGWRMMPIVEQYEPSRASDVWGRVDAGELEGLVVVATGARIGARGGKRKCKAQSTIDAVVVDVDGRTLRCMFAGHSFCVNRAARDVATGDIVEVLHDGWYESGVTPRFARILRVRRDLAG